MATNRYERLRYWNHWQNFVKPFNNMDAMLTNSRTGDELPAGIRISLLGAFARRVRTGSYNPTGKQVGCQAVQVALRAVGATFELDGKPNPTYRSEGRYWLAIERQLEGYRRKDPPVVAKLAAPVRLVNHISDVGFGKGTARALALGDMCLIAFYFLLRVGEYTSHRKGEQRRTTQFRAKDITFFDTNRDVIPHTAALKQLLEASSATMRIDNQKNGTRGGTIHHSAIVGRRCPIKALARRVHHIMNHPEGGPDDIISTFFSTTNRRFVLTSASITKAIRTAAVAIGLDKKGFPTKSLSSHSLRAGGATAMHLNGISSSTIRKMGRWSSDTFLMYIHEQIAAFSQGVSQKMATEIGWDNIEGPTFEDVAAAA